jgi:hypothetical protein
VIPRLLFAAAVLCTTEAAAQVEGYVRSARGDALAGAEVVLWGSGRVLATLASDQAGRFHSAIDRDSLRRISVHYLGFGAEIVSGDRFGTGPVEVRLTPLPVPLPEIAVFVTRDICDEAEDEEARAFWEAARAPYRKDTGSRGGLAWGRGLEVDVRADKLGDYRDDRLVVWGRGWGRWPTGEEDEQGIPKTASAKPVTPGGIRAEAPPEPNAAI